MYAATTKDEGNAADGRFPTACPSLAIAIPSQAGETISKYLIAPSFNAGEGCPLGILLIGLITSGTLIPTITDVSAWHQTTDI